MSDYTNYFDLYKCIQEQGIVTEKPELQETKRYSDEELLVQLRKILSGIITIDDYETLVSIIEELQSQLTLRFLYLFFQALADVEERVWNSMGMNPPIRAFIEQNIDMLLDKYDVFCTEMEAMLVAWTKTNGYFTQPEYYAKIKKRNTIFSRYVCAAGVIVGELT